MAWVWWIDGSSAGQVGSAGGASFLVGWRLRVGAVAAGRWGSLWAYSVVHGGLWHWLVNGVGVWVTGRTFERVWGSGAVLWCGVLGCLGGALGYLLTVWLDCRVGLLGGCVGASGVLAGLLGGLCARVAGGRLRGVVLGVPFWVRTEVLAGVVLLLIGVEAFVWPQVTAYGAHLGGFILGGALTRWGGAADGAALPVGRD